MWVAKRWNWTRLKKKCFQLLIVPQARLKDLEFLLLNVSYFFKEKVTASEKPQIVSCNLAANMCRKVLKVSCHKLQVILVFIVCLFLFQWLYLVLILFFLSYCNHLTVAWQCTSSQITAFLMLKDKARKLYRRYERPQPTTVNFLKDFVHKINLY